MNEYRFIKPLVMAIAISATSSVMADEHGAHVHGAAKLQVAIDGNTATVMLDSPMDSLVGFEHAPGNDAEKAAISKLVSALNKPESLFVFSPAAGCAPSSVKLDSPLIADQTQKDNKAHKGNGDHEEEHAHAHKDNKEHEEHEEHKHDKQQTHSDLDGEFVFTCKTAGQLKGLTVNLFDVAANLQDLDVEVAGPEKQTAAELSSKKRSVNW